MTNIKIGKRNLKKFLLIAAIGSIAFATPSFAQEQTPTLKQDNAQRSVDKKNEKLKNAQHKVDKKQVKMDKQESKMNKKQRKVDALQSPVNKKPESQK